MAAFVIAKIANRVNAAHQRNESSQANHQRTQRIGIKEAAEGFHLPSARYFRTHCQRQARHRNEASQVELLQPVP